MVTGPLSRIFLLLLLQLVTLAVCGQQTVAGQPQGIGPVQVAQAGSEVVEHDTIESITFLGKKLWFEVRRRLNLTSEAEQAEQKQAEQRFKLRVGTLQVTKAGSPSGSPQR
jgi:hypothetical protein